MQETQETRVQSLGGEDPLEEEMAAHSRILAWHIPWTEEPGGLQFMWSQRGGHDWAHTHMGGVERLYLNPVCSLKAQQELSDGILGRIT